MTTVLSTFRNASRHPSEAGTVVISILQVRALTHREVRCFAQRHTVQEVPELNLKASGLLPVFIACAFQGFVDS